LLKGKCYSGEFRRDVFVQITKHSYGGQEVSERLGMP